MSPHDRPTFGSLFAGIGGIDVGLERAGWECRFQVEWDPFCQRVLAKHWPDVPRYGDIHDVHGPLAHAEGDAGRIGDGDGLPDGCRSCLPVVDILAGGFPCQPFSVAGRRAGMEDDRWLWPEFARTIRELRPRYVLVENVPGLLVGGGMGAVLGDLADLGYDAEWESIPAAAVGAPHLRYRIWIVAYANRDGEPSESVDAGSGCGQLVPAGPLAYANEPRPQGRPIQPERSGERAARSGSMADAYPSGRDGRSGEQWPGRWGEPANGGWWSAEPDVGRVAHGVPARVDRLRSLGNAVVPQVVEWIGRRILDSEMSSARMRP